MITALLVDDRATVRQALRMRLALEPDMVIVGEAEDGAVAVELAGALQPDVVIMDIAMPRMDGIAATTALRALNPASAVVMLSIYDTDVRRRDAEAAGVRAFVGKCESDDRLLATIRAVAGKAA